MHRYLVFSLLFVLAGCSDPWVMLPGGKLSGTVASFPENWDFTHAVEVVQLEVRPTDPYSVNVWGVGVGDRFYIGTAGPDEDGSVTAWAQMIEEDPTVVLRVNELLYPMHAVRTDDGDEIERAVAEYVTKYEYDFESEGMTNAWLYRLTPRLE